MNLFYQPGIAEGNLFLGEEESRHVVKVLRLGDGDTIQVTDGKGHLFTAEIDRADSRRCSFIIRASEILPRLAASIHVAVVPTKNMDRMEWFVEKACEIGIERITFFRSRHSERTVINIERLEKIAVAAMKQSQQAWLPTLSGMVTFSDVLRETADQKFIAVVDKTNPSHLKDLLRPGGKSLVLIGPEGDFEPTEVSQALEAGFVKASLGANRLRTETAALVAVHLASLARA